MTTPQPVNSHQRSAAAAQSEVKPVWLFVAVVIVTSVFWPFLPVFSKYGGEPKGFLIPSLQIFATVAMVRSEWTMSARPTADTSTSSRPFWLYVSMAVAISAVTLVWWRVLMSGYRHSSYYVTTTAWLSDRYESLLWAPATFIALVGTVACAVIRAKKLPKSPPKSVTRLSLQPIGHTTDGQPIYPIVGYTPDGQPVTADRAVGIHPTAAGTNSIAIVALITGLTIAPLGIVFGHIALNQIKQTGQGGRGLAIAGLVLGYVSVASYAIIFVAIGAHL